MRRRAITTAVATAAAWAAAAGAAGAQDHGGHGSEPLITNVGMAFSTFEPARVDILAGETVRWNNNSFRAHTVGDNVETWFSGRVVSGDAFSHRFDTPGVVPYHCQIHPGMVGEVGVYELLLDLPKGGAAPRRPFPVTGRSSLEPGTELEIQADEGQGYQPIGRTTVAADGDISATITPRQTAALRVVAGQTASPPVELVVLDRTLRATVTRRGANAVFSAAVAPASPGATVVVQLRLPERFGWWPVRIARLDAASRARIVVPLRRRVPARVLLTLPDGATELATSGTLKVPPLRRATKKRANGKRPATAPPAHHH